MIPLQRKAALVLFVVVVCGVLVGSVSARPKVSTSFASSLIQSLAAYTNPFGSSSGIIRKSYDGTTVSSRFCGLDSSNSCNWTPYLGMLIMQLAVPIAIAIITLLWAVIWWSLRCCCNCCGGSPPEDKFTKMEVLVPRVIVLVCCCVFVAASIMGYDGTSMARNGLSGAIDGGLANFQTVITTMQNAVTTLSAAPASTYISTSTLQSYLSSAQSAYNSTVSNTNTVKSYDYYRYAAGDALFGIAIVQAILSGLLFLLPMRITSYALALIGYPAMFFFWIWFGLNLPVGVLFGDLCYEFYIVVDGNSTTTSTAATDSVFNCNTFSAVSMLSSINSSMSTSAGQSCYWRWYLGSQLGVGSNWGMGTPTPINCDHCSTTATCSSGINYLADWNDITLFGNYTYDPNTRQKDGTSSLSDCINNLGTSCAGVATSATPKSQAISLNTSISATIQMYNVYQTLLPIANCTFFKQTIKSIADPFCNTGESGAYLIVMAAVLCACFSILGQVVFAMGINRFNSEYWEIDANKVSPEDSTHVKSYHDTEMARR
eukprot:gnl/Hemi2/18617_TR6160_c0_g1_i1.p1 gnl/Hemi2/18617_TR6160_c0_g1~~gnl/Hemi2/18617_TR6160_c0_g1_i1.p1  ORF type:complete len:544 (+),score=121.09 gnl/Hemi2/18617_TR6160_c0_g1_i1:169-1800(+)